MLHVFNSQFWPLKWNKTTVFWLITTKHSLSVNELSFLFSDTCLKDYTFAFSWLILSLIWLSLSFNVSHHYQLELLSSFLTLVDNIKQKRSFTHYNIRMVNLWSFSQLLIDKCLITWLSHCMFVAESLHISFDMKYLYSQDTPRKK